MMLPLAFSCLYSLEIAAATCGLTCLWNFSTSGASVLPSGSSLCWGDTVSHYKVATDNYDKFTHSILIKWGWNVCTGIPSSTTTIMTRYVMMELSSPMKVASVWHDVTMITIFRDSFQTSPWQSSQYSYFVTVVHVSPANTLSQPSEVYRENHLIKFCVLVR